MAQKTQPPKIDKEFSNLLPPLNPSEFTTLEQMCIRDGIGIDINPDYCRKAVVMMG